MSKTSHRSPWSTIRLRHPAEEVLSTVAAVLVGAVLATTKEALPVSVVVVGALPLVGEVTSSVEVGEVGGIGKKYVVLILIFEKLGSHNFVRIRELASLLWLFHPSGPSLRRSNSIVFPNSGWKLTSPKTCMSNIFLPYRVTERYS
jgi:hypothetical protein